MIDSCFISLVLWYNSISTYDKCLSLIIKDSVFVVEIEFTLLKDKDRISYLSGGRLQFYTTLVPAVTMEPS
jgi:hypothetical protein